MEKKNTGSQRSRDTAPTNTPANSSTATLESACPETKPASGPDSLAVQEAQERLRSAADSIADSGRSDAVRPPETILDERDDVMTVINELEDQLDRHQDVREKLERDLKDSNEKLQTAGQRVQELEWQVVTLQTRVEALEQVRQEVTLLEEELASTNGEMQRLSEEHARDEKERTRLKSELKTANKQLEELWALRKERDGLRIDLKNLTNTIAELERAHQDLIDERNALTNRVNETTLALDEARSERHHHQILMRAAEDRAHQLARVQEELADKLETIRADKRNLQGQVTQLERENARLLEQRQFYETELASMRNASRNAEAALSSVKKAFAEVRVALTETKTRARRRMIETWPRIGVPFRSNDHDEALKTSIRDTQTVAATAETANADEPSET